MKRVLLTVSMILLAVPAFAGEINSAVNWTGCYVGGNLGYLWERDRWSDPASPATNFTPIHSNGASGGAQAGCDYQNGNWVLGLQGMFDWMDFSSVANNHSAPIASFNHNKLDSFYTVKGRLGYASGPSLFYIDGGLAGVKTDRFSSNGLVGNGPTVSDTKTGWVAGLGWEYMFSPQWSWFVEYDHMDLGTERVAFATPLNAKQKADVAMIGLNFRFGGR